MPHETDKSLLFGLIAMQSDLIEMRQFVDACTLWGSRKENSLADILAETTHQQVAKLVHSDAIVE